MGKQRKFSRHQFWSEYEIEVLRADYESSDWGHLLSKLPGRSKSKIQNKAYSLGLRRPVVERMTDDERRKRKRELMARRRSENPEKVRRYQRMIYYKNREFQLAYQKQLRGKRFFWNRSNRLKGKGKATYRQLAALWKAQRGRCALSGERLTRDNVEIDHKTPKSRGGNDRIENLQWVTFTANRAKRDLTDDEFFALCKSCLDWIGQRIAGVAR